MPSGAAPKTGSKASARRQSFAFAGDQIRAGTTRAIELPVARLPHGSWSTMPVIIAHGARPGPTIWANGAIHGDELNGVEIIRRLVRRVPARRLAGTLIAVPIVNVFGVTTGSRYLHDRRDLNRSFPGSARGSLAGRLAHLFFDSIAARCELGFDFHTGSGGRCNFPQVRCDLDDEQTRRLAEVFAAPLLLHSKVRDGSLRAAADAQGIRVLLYEAGEAMRFDDRVIDLGVDGVLRVMHALGMVDDDPPPPAQAPVTAHRSAWTRASRSGFCHLDVKLGQRVAAGDHVASIADSVGAKAVPAIARNTGLVIGVLRTALVHRGDALVHIAEVDA